MCVTGVILDRKNLTEVFEAEERRLQVPKSLTKGGIELIY